MASGTGRLIEVDFDGEIVSPRAIVLRAQDNNNLVQFQLELDRSYWMLKQDGEWLELVTGDGTYWHTPSNRRGHLRIEVRGNFYTAYLDDESWLSIDDGMFSGGQVGLGIYCDNTHFNCNSYDNFVIRELPE